MGLVVSRKSPLCNELNGLHALKQDQLLPTKTLSLVRKIKAFISDIDDTMASVISRCARRVPESVNSKRKAGCWPLYKVTTINGIYIIRVGERPSSPRGGLLV